MDPSAPTPTTTLIKSKLDEVTSFFHNPYSTQIGGMIGMFFIQIFYL